MRTFTKEQVKKFARLCQAFYQDPDGYQRYLGVPAAEVYDRFIADASEALGIPADEEGLHPDVMEILGDIC